MKATHRNEKGKKECLISVKFDVTSALIRKAIIHSLEYDKTTTKKAIIEEIKSVAYEYGHYGYGETINNQDIENYDEYKLKADMLIKKYFPSFVD
jgi:hypothetical protein